MENRNFIYSKKHGRLLSMPVMNEPSQNLYDRNYAYTRTEDPEAWDKVHAYKEWLSNQPLADAKDFVDGKSYMKDVDFVIEECEICGGDGRETCNNPDHGFIEAMPGDVGRLGCPVCGHDPKHKVKNGGKCDNCNGSGKVAIPLGNSIEQLPCGSLFLYGETMALKSEYRTNEGACECYIVGSGEMFWGGTNTAENLNQLKVKQIIL